ncbi:hypothetical protein GE09DRAFT_303045 [Coniochaeta sp. 2T2.1]|nr:hypothetical protein GE09DRAFT_303045 [Coniochaeta sp. 2T2.1]
MGEKHNAFIPGFRSLGPSIFILDGSHTAVYQPWSQAQQPTTAGSPDLILITSWTGAVPRHVAKYVQSYNDLYPHTPIMVITTQVADLALHSTKHKTSVLAPAVKYIRHRHSTRDINQILLHAFSDGGSNKAVCLAEAYLASTGHRLPVAASVLDSTPGTERYSSNLAAFKRSLPSNKAVRSVGLVVGAVLIAIHWVWFSVFMGHERNVFAKTRRGLNDQTLWNLDGMPRTYVFSQADDLISWKDIEEHATDAAERLGTTSMLVRFKNSGHCCHAREDEEYYWTAVRRTWESRDVEALPMGAFS